MKVMGTANNKRYRSRMGVKIIVPKDKTQDPKLDKLLIEFLAFVRQWKSVTWCAVLNGWYGCVTTPNEGPRFLFEVFVFMPSYLPASQCVHIIFWTMKQVALLHSLIVMLSSLWWSKNVGCKSEIRPSTLTDTVMHCTQWSTALRVIVIIMSEGNTLTYQVTNIKVSVPK